MPPMVARLDVEMSGANCNPKGFAAWSRSSPRYSGWRSRRHALLLCQLGLRINPVIDPSAAGEMQGHRRDERDRSAQNQRTALLQVGGDQVERTPLQQRQAKDEVGLVK